MKNFAVTALTLLSFCITTYSQTNEALKEKMKIFQAWTGQWKGEGSIQMGPGEPKKSLVDEKIESRLDGTIIVVEGVGTSNGQIVHHAFGVLSFDQPTNQYRFKTYLKDGKSADAWFNVVAENNYQWGFDVPRGKMKYTITIDPVKKTWNEIGEYSPDGSTWHKSFEMNLTKAEQ